MNKNIVDGFDERKVFINNARDKNRINSKNVFLDNSFAKMKVSENGASVKTTNQNKEIKPEEAKGDKKNFVIRNFNFDHANRPIQSKSISNSIDSALNDIKNRFKKF